MTDREYSTEELSEGLGLMEILVLIAGCSLCTRGILLLRSEGKTLYLRKSTGPRRFIRGISKKGSYDIPGFVNTT